MMKKLVLALSAMALLATPLFAQTVDELIEKNMKAHGRGSIVNVGSMRAHQAVKATPSSAHSMQKAGLHSLTQHFAMELAEFGIRASAVAPAVVVTPIYSVFIEPAMRILLRLSCG